MYFESPSRDLTPGQPSVSVSSHRRVAAPEQGNFPGIMQREIAISSLGIGLLHTLDELLKIRPLAPGCLKRKTLAQAQASAN